LFARFVARSKRVDVTRRLIVALFAMPLQPVSFDIDTQHVALLPHVHAVYLSFGMKRRAKRGARVICAYLICRASAQMSQFPS